MDPLHIEHSFRALKQELAVLRGNRNKLLRLVKFVEDYQSPDCRGFLYAYAQEILSLFVPIIIITDFHYTNPVFLHRIENTLLLLSEIRSKEEKSDEVREAIERIQVVREAIERQMASRSENGGSIELSASRRRRKGVTARTKSKQRDHVWIPMVDCEPLIENANPAFASLRKARVHMQFSRNGSDEDVIIIDQLIDPEGKQPSQVRIALEAARKLFTSLTKIQVTIKLIVHCSFDRRTMIEGESLGAGLAALLVTELIRLHQFKRELFLRDDIAITGAIDVGGNVLPVDEEGLKKKVEACIFSWIKTIIVPKGQEELCKKFLDNYHLIDGILKDFAPTILPKIIGISNLEEIFYDRRLSQSERVGVTKQTIKKVWKYRRSFATIFFVVLIIIIMRERYTRLDLNPSSVKYEGEVLNILNRYEIKIGEIFIGKQRVTPAVIYDIDSDGIRDVIFGHERDEKSKSLSFVCCYSLSKDKLLWRYNLDRGFSIPKEFGNDDRSFFCRELGISNLGKGLGVRVIGTAVSAYSPCYVFEIKIDGNEVGKYFHYGHLNGPRFVDLNGDGLKEALFAGVNNWCNEACLVVLDARFISGVCLIESNKKPESLLSCEKYYLKIPMTDVYSNLVEIG